LVLHRLQSQQTIYEALFQSLAAAEVLAVGSLWFDQLYSLDRNQRLAFQHPLDLLENGVSIYSMLTIVNPYFIDMMKA
jgi:hypothetical protein